MQKYFFFLLFLFSFNVFIYANDGYYEIGEGGELIPLQNEYISMESEHIIIDVYQLDRYSYYAVYNCEFSFKNNSNKYLNILMGFPINYGLAVSTQSAAKKKNDVSDFKVLIDNTEVKYKWFIHGVNSQLPEIKPYDEVYGFNVVFKAKEKKKIINSYSMYISPGDLGRPKINYIVLSGLTWKGDITSARFLIRFHFPVHIYTLDGFNIKKNDESTVMEKNITNFTPKSDINIGFEAKITFPENTYRIMGESARSKNLLFDYPELYRRYISKMNADELKKARYTILAEHGFIGRDEEEINYLNEMFYSKRNYQKNPAVKYEDIPEEELLLFYTLGQENHDVVKYNYDSIIKRYLGELNSENQLFYTNKLLFLLEEIRKKCDKSDVDYGLVTKAESILKAIFIMKINDKNTPLAYLIHIKNSNLLKNDEALNKKLERLIKTGKMKSIDGKMAQISEITKRIEKDIQNEQFFPAALRIEGYFADFSYYFYYDDEETRKKYEKKKEACDTILKKYFLAIVRKHLAACHNETALITTLRDLGVRFFGYRIRFPVLVSKIIYELGVNIKNKIDLNMNVQKLELLFGIIKKGYKNNKYLSSYEEGLPYIRLIEYLTYGNSDIRFGYYALANYYFNRNKIKALGYYLAAFKYSESNYKRINDIDKLQSQNLSEWKDEGATNAPCYYIAYNICCVYSLLNDLQNACYWFEIVLKLHYPNKDWLLQDPDITNFRENNKEAFNRLLQEYLEK